MNEFILVKHCLTSAKPDYKASENNELKKMDVAKKY